jgi:fucose permease
MSTLNAFPMVSSTLLPLAVTGAAAATISWRVAYLAPVLVIGAAITLVAARSAVPSTSAAQPARLRELIDVPHLRRRWLVLVFGILVEIGTVTWAASIMRDLGGASKSTAASLTIGFFIGMFTGRLALTHVLRRFDEQRLLWISFVGAFVSLIPFLAGPAMPFRIVGLTGVGIFLSPIYPLGVARLFELHQDTNALGRVAALASGVGVTFGPLLLGTLSDHIGLGKATVVLPIFAVGGLLTLGTQQTVKQRAPAA